MRASESLKYLVGLEHGLDFPGRRVQTVDDLLVPFGVQKLVFRKMVSYHQKDNVLRSVSLQEVSAM